ncbi:MAG: 50S ribosomal protein L29 [Candidatus Brocadiaceae bacterium]|nr:50S ribosomal protein L29 [Candidatus Brocadiaceae bacterium]
MNPVEIRDKSKQEIVDEIEACRRELLNIQIQWQSGESKSTTQKSRVRKNVARMRTILREMDLGINVNLKLKEDIS